MTDQPFSVGPAMRAVRKGTNIGVTKAANEILDASNQQVPVDEGDLKSSGRVGVDRSAAAITYSDKAAVIVHEMLTKSHSSGNAKFLENAMNANRDTVVNEVLRAIRAELGT